MLQPTPSKLLNAQSLIMFIFQSFVKIFRYYLNFDRYSRQLYSLPILFITSIARAKPLSEFVITTAPCLVSL